MEAVEKRDEVEVLGREIGSRSDLERRVDDLVPLGWARAFSIEPG
jgi:hypothetical protein